MSRVRYLHRVRAAPHVAGIAPPVNTVAPAITGDTAGDLLTVSDGTWTGSPAFTYAWFRNGVVIAGETTNSLQTDEAWAGDTIVAIVYGGNGAGKVGASSNSVVLQEAPAYTGPLDLVPGAVFAYGQRALSAVKLGTAVYTIRDDKTGVTQSFNSDLVTGAVDSAAIAAIISAPFTKTAATIGPFITTGAVVDTTDTILLSDASGVEQYASITGDDIPPGTYVLDISSAPTIQISAPATGTNPSESLSFSRSTQNQVTLTNGTGVSPGQYISGAGIPDNTQITDTSSSPVISISNTATETHASETVTITPHGRVIIWNDQSESGASLDSGSANAYPAWVSNQSNGNPAVTGLKTNQELATTLDVSFPNGVATIFFVCKKTGSLDMEFNTSDYVQFSTGNSAQEDIYVDDTGDEAFAQFDNAVSLSDYVIWDGAWGLESKSLRANGVDLPPTNVFDSGDSIGPIIDRMIVTFGNDTGGTLEVIAWPTILSDADRLAIRQNIAAYYGITL